MAVLSSCGEKDYPHDEEIMVSFSFSAQESLTRAGHDWDDNFDNNADDTSESDAYDSRIKFNSLRAFIYDNSGDFVCEITNRAYFELSKDIYRFLGGIRLTSDMYEQLDVDEDGVVDACKVMLVANSTFQDEDPAKFSTTTFSVDNLKMPNGFIPMWGVTTATLNFQPNQDLGNIYLLRSAAKVEIELDQTLVNNEGYKIASVSINRHASEGFVYPKDWDRVGDTRSLYHFENEDKYGCYNPSTSVLSISKNFTRISDSKYVIYLPEMDTDEGVAMTVFLEKDTKEFEFVDAIKFVDYDDDGLATETTFDIVRNHHYQYNITRVNTEQQGSLAITCNVAPWELYEETWDYTDQIVVVDEGRIVWSDYSSLNTNNGEVVLSPGKDLKGRFNINTPVGAQWRAEFISISGSMNSFQFTMPDTDNMKKNSDASAVVGNITDSYGQSLVHEITIAPRNTNIDENNYAYLRFSVITQDGRTIHVKELTNSNKYFDYTIIQSR